MSQAPFPKKTLIVFYSHSGVTRRIAEILQSKTQADMVAIETVRTYTSDHSEQKKSWIPASFPI